MTYGIPKPPPKFKEKAKRRAQLLQEQRDVYRLVDRREGFHCRACGCRCRQTMEAVANRWEHHHIRPRSLGGLQEIANVVGLCLDCHSQATRHELTISGNAMQTLTFQRGRNIWHR